MKKLLILITSLALVALVLYIIFHHKPNPDVCYTIQEHKTCQATSNYKICAEAPQGSQRDCNLQAQLTALCLGPDGGDTYAACRDWWQYFEENYDSSCVPDSYKKCIKHCSQFAHPYCRNSSECESKDPWYYNNNYKLLWMNCGAENNY